MTEAFVARFDADGTPDAGFGAGGLATFALGSQADGSSYPRVGSIDVAADGSIVLSGAAAETSGVVDLVVARLNPSGTLDAGFGSEVVALLSVPGGVDLDATSSGVKALPDGQIPIAGTANQLPASGRIAGGGFSSPGYADVVIARLNPNGQLDLTFGATFVEPGTAYGDGGVVVIGAVPADPSVAGSFLFGGLGPGV